MTSTDADEQAGPDLKVRLDVWGSHEPNNFYQ